MKKYSIKNILLLILAAVAVVWLIFAVYSFVTFRVTKTDPKLGRVSVISPYIKMSFNKQLSEQKPDFNSTDSIVSSIDIKGKDMYLNFSSKPLVIDQEYTVTLGDIKAKDGKTIKSQKLTFTAKDIPYEKLSKEQQQAILANQDKPIGSRDDPILKHLPYGDVGYNIEAEAISVLGTTTIIVNAEIILAKSDLSNKDAVILKSKQDINDYIISVGLDPGKYTINYSVTEPSIY